MAAMLPRIIDESPVVVEERPADAVSIVDQHNYATLWPNPELQGVDPATRWLRLGRASEAVLIGWHAWASGPDTRHPVVRLEPTGDGAVRIASLGAQTLTGAVGFLEPRPLGRPPGRATVPRPRPLGIGAEVVGLAAMTTLLVALAFLVSQAAVALLSSAPG